MTPVPPRRGRRTRRQLELLDRLKVLFLAEGFAHFTLDELADRLRCSKTTLYALAPSKEQLAVAVVRHYFVVAANYVEFEIAAVGGARDRVGRYLAAIGEQMAEAGERFLDDVEAFPPAREVYDRNIHAAADRVRALVDEGIAEGVFRTVRADFVAEMVAATAVAIQRGEVRRRTGMTDAESFAELSTLVLQALRPTRATPRS